MREYAFDVRISGIGRAVESFETSRGSDDRSRQARGTEALRERVYARGESVVRVRADDWPTSMLDDGEVRLSLQVVDEGDQLPPRDVPAFVELFVHDAFLLCNLASPGSFGAVVTAAGGEFRVNDVRLDGRLFEYAALAASRLDGTRVEALPLRDVTDWYDELEIGTRQLASTPTERALFQLLHFAHCDCGEVGAIVRLGAALDALFELAPLQSSMSTALFPFFAIRSEVARGTAPVIHPMHDELLDAEVDDSALDWIDAIDVALAAVVGSLQEQVREWRRARHEP